MAKTKNTKLTPAQRLARRESKRQARFTRTVSRIPKIVSRLERLGVKPEGVKAINAAVRRLRLDK